MMPENKGFTLIELSIVLVVIGLLVGGILVGRNLIRSAEIRKTVSQIERFNAATNTFKLKFGCLPGDCAYASSLGFTDQFGGTSYTNGNGDGRVDRGQVNVYNMEQRNFFWHLSQANLIGEALDYPTDPNINLPWANAPGAETPYSPINQRGTGNWNGTIYHIGGWMVYYFDSGVINSYVNFTGSHIFLLNICANSGCSEAIEMVMPADMYALDTKLDDGLPESGSLIATSQGGYGNYTASYGAAGSSTCMNSATTPYTYNVQNGNYACSMMMKAQF